MRIPAIFLSVFMSVLAAAWVAFEYRVPLAAACGLLTPAAPVALLDSLPALEGGLSDLEAYAVAPWPGGRASPARTVWWAPRAESLMVEFYTSRRARDSTRLFVWSEASGAARKMLRQEGSAQWAIPLGRTRTGWNEIVGVFVSHPRLLDRRASDSSISIFERVEGRTLHLVSGRYSSRPIRCAHPDTMYPAPAEGEIELLARGDALAVVNPGKDIVRVGLVHMPSGHRDLCEIRAGSVHVYRSLLRGTTGPLLAYTDAGNTRPLLFREKRTDDYFWLDRPQTPPLAGPEKIP
jgi:hypothetical protein